jgi:protein-S-isoprenylcysteine O-methyltransferase Ste14
MKSLDVTLVVVNVALLIILLTAPPMADMAMPQVVVWYVIVAAVTLSGLHSAWRVFKRFASIRAGQRQGSPRQGPPGP